MAQSGEVIRWANETRYLGIYLVSARVFTCSLDHARKSFNRAVNGILGKIGLVAHEDVILELIKKKCLPILLYGSEVLSLNKAKFCSLDFSLIRLAMKIFRTSNRQLVIECLSNFGFSLPSVCVTKRFIRFTEKFRKKDNLMCKLVSNYDYI